MNEAEVRKYLNVMKRAIQLIEAQLTDDGGLLEKMAVSEPAAPVVAKASAPPVVQPAEPASVPKVDEEWLKQRKKHIGDLLGIREWPEAVAPRLATTSVKKEDQINRANAVLDMMLDRPLEKTHFLDFGCGEGWVVNQVHNRGVVSATGYDIKGEPCWTEMRGTYTTKYGDLKPKSYDILLMYDVLDHCEDPVDAMNKIYDLAKLDSRVYVRCHPWTSKHANHIYKYGLNKSYIHLFLTWQEMKEIVNNFPMFTRTEKDPITAYRWWFSKFDIVKERLIEEDVHPFFLIPAFRELIQNENQIDPAQMDNFLRSMRIQFVDYILTPKPSA